MKAGSPVKDGTLDGAASALRIHGLKKAFADVRAVDGINLEVAAGECFGLLGPNGAGKTTTIEICEGLTAPDAGAVELLGLNWQTGAEELRQRIGIQLQETQFPDKLTVEEALRLFRSFYRRGITLDESIGMAQLEEKRRARIGGLSGGQKQRLAMATALVGDPELLFLDEPTTGLDPQARLHLWELVEKLKSAGRTIILTTHYMEEAERLCDRIVIVDHGQVVANDTLQGLYRLLPVTNSLRVELDETKNGLRIGDVRALPGVHSAEFDSGTLRVGVEDLAAQTPCVLQWLVEHGHSYHHVSSERADLETVFLTLTGRSLRDS